MDDYEILKFEVMLDIVSIICTGFLGFKVDYLFWFLFLILILFLILDILKLRKILRNV